MKGSPMMDCDRFRMDFSNYLEGELHSEHRKKLDDHFSICPECYEIFRRMSDIQKRLKNLLPIGTSPGFEQRLQETILRQNQHPGFIPAQLQNWKLPAMGSAIVVATVSLFLVFNNSPAPENPGVNAQFKTAAPQIQSSAPKQANSPDRSVQSSYESTTLIPDSLESDSARFRPENIQQVNGK